jgi:hypothetical protein
MWEIDGSETSEVVTNKLEREWNKTMAKFRQKHGSDAAGNNKNVTAIYKTNIRNNEEELILNVSAVPGRKIVTLYFLPIFATAGQSRANGKSK